jgi:endo-1,4-beta-xylanase
MQVRQSVLAGITSAATSTAFARAASEESDSADDGLGRLAAKKGLLFGAVMMRAELSPKNQAVFAREVRLITPRKELKTAAVRPTPHHVGIPGADTLVAFADKHDLTIRGHTLC